MAVAAGLQAGCDSNSYTAGIDGSGVRIYTSGPIEAFGSIVLNGTHYDIAAAQIVVNGETATEASLALGQVVTVQANDVGGGRVVADTVVFNADVIGPVDAVDVSGGTLVVLAQGIRIGTDTLLELGPGNGLARLRVGDLLEISGFRNSRGGINATRIALADPAADFRVIGRVSQLDAVGFEFSLGNLVVDYSSAGLIEGFPTGAPMGGDKVLVVGQALSGTGALVATRLELADDDSAQRAGQRVEVEGLITRFVSPMDFDVAGSQSTTTGATNYEGGSVANLELNVKIEIEGRFDAQGTIVADKIEVKDGGAVQQ
jgi:hypothetical protein